MQEIFAHIIDCIVSFRLSIVDNCAQHCESTVTANILICSNVALKLEEAIFFCRYVC